MNKEKALTIWLPVIADGVKDLPECKESLEMAIEALENQKTGHWINRLNIYANRTIDTKVCSECRYEYSYDAETGISNANFCPNCGAKMEGEKE